MINTPENSASNNVYVFTIICGHIGQI